MDYKLKPPSALDYFTALVQSDDEFPLLETAISLAQDEFPSLDIQQVLSDMDHWTARLKRSILPGADALDKLRELNHFFYSNLRFAGNLNHYDNPHNSYLNVVMSTRLGIPISMAVLWLELGQSIGLPVFVKEADRLADLFGDHLRPPALLREMAAQGQTFYGHTARPAPARQTQAA